MLAQTEVDVPLDFQLSLVKQLARAPDGAAVEVGPKDEEGSTLRSTCTPWRRRSSTARRSISTQSFESKSSWLCRLQRGGAGGGDGADRTGDAEPRGDPRCQGAVHAVDQRRGRGLFPAKYRSYPRAT